jgi:hypothetical protein
MIEIKNIGGKKCVFIREAQLGRPLALQYNIEVMGCITESIVNSHPNEKLVSRIEATKRAMELVAELAKKMQEVGYLEGCKLLKSQQEAAHSTAEVELYSLVSDCYTKLVNRYLSNVLPEIGKIDEYVHDLIMVNEDGSESGLDPYVKMQPAIYPMYSAVMEEIHKLVIDSILTDNLIVRIIQGQEVIPNVPISIMECNMEIYLPVLYGPWLAMRNNLNDDNVKFTIGEDHSAYKLFKDFKDKVGLNCFLSHLGDKINPSGLVEVYYNLESNKFICYRSK